MVESKRSKCKKDSEKGIANIWHNTHRVKKKKREFISTKRISFVVVVVVVYHSEQQIVKKKITFRCSSIEHESVLEKRLLIMLLFAFYRICSYFESSSISS